MASISIVFRKDKLNKRGEGPIHFRIIKDRKIRYLSSGHLLPEDHWDFKKHCVKAKHPNSARLNASLTKRFSDFQKELLDQERNNKSLTANQLRERIYGKKPTSFIAFAEEANKEYLRECQIGTFDKNASIIKKLKDYVGERDITFQDITAEFLIKYERYLKDTLKNKTNTIHRDFKFIRKLFNDAYRQELIEHSVIPFNKFKMKTEKTQRVYLTESELAKIEKLKVTKGTRMELHKNMFVFAAYTGLRISDILQLQWKHFDGKHIHFTIKKTETQISTKLPDKALAIFKKYKLKKADKNAFIFPQLPTGVALDNPRELDTAVSRSTAYINKNLKLIGQKAKLDKKLSFHISRHTFATRALTKGISIDKVSKLMGHAAIRETQVYAKIVNSELDKAMDVFND